MVLLVGCPRPLDPEQPCEEIAYAIGARTEECTGDGELGEARVQALLDGYECLDRAEVPEGQSESGGDDAFACALVLRDVACELVAEAVTNDDGRCDSPILEGDAFTTGKYELVFHAGGYFDARGYDLPEPRFLDEVSLRFGIAAAGEHYHVPLLLSPFSFSTYRGS